MALVLALGTLGIGYAMWSDTVYIEGTVYTGEVEVGWEQEVAYWPNNSNDPVAEDGTPGVIHPTNYLEGTVDQGWNGTHVVDYDKNVAACNITVDTENGTHEAYGHPVYLWARIALLNGYPCYLNIAELEVDNSGTIPVKLYEVRLDADCDNTYETAITPFTTDKPVANDWVDIDLDGDGRFDINVAVWVPSDTQIEPCDHIFPEVWIHVKQECPQGLTDSFKLSLEFAQWNEVT